MIMIYFWQSYRLQFVPTSRLPRNWRTDVREFEQTSVLMYTDFR